MHWPNGASTAARCQMHLFRQTT
ncbi:hypothetical protein DS909_08610 [Phaeobacter gallaeciensis]|uniref:Uncharacterized protein n=2 Tax=Roseobacteraceae TaxID=2854170 RepID=A0A366X5R4_9RHOB|nr:hypothetical protein [Falsiruegeria litorea]MBT8168364.1 hypothetical protein [Falsiruegeria litorea]RBW56913.1 hypothetical protein DS909_08610 [Phaeobacter gallaeciensis]